jgi:hypothetical protein
MRILRMIIALSGTLLAVTAVLANEGAGNPAIGTLSQEDLQSLPYMCECEFFRAPIDGATTVFATRSERAVAFVMVDGHLVTLHRDAKPNGASCGKNLRYREHWVGDATAVVLDYRATGSGEESCWFKGRMSIAVGRRTTSTGISGACGC